MDKIERLISIIMILLKKDIVSTKEFTQLFDVSKRTVLRDMEALSLANVPIYSVLGVNGGYGIMEEYKVDKRLLSNTDLENILIALGGLDKILINDEVEVTLKKIEAMVSPMSLKGSIQLSFYNWEGRSEIIQALKLCEESIVKRRVVTFQYIDINGTKTNRTIEPYQLHYSEMSWYIKGFCLQRQSYRTFKLSRIDHLCMSEHVYSPRDFVIDQEHIVGYQPELVTIKAVITPSIKDQFIERYGRKSIADYDSTHFLATIYVPQNSIGFQFLAGFGEKLKVIEPQDYVNEFRDYLTNMLEMYR